MEIHDAANLFPLDEEHLDELAADIKAHGQKVPVELLDGRIIDGRRRAAACERISITPKTIDKTGEIDDPVSYVLSLNLHRRQLTPSQRSMIAARARDIYDAQAAERMKATLKKGDKPAMVNLPERENGTSRDMAGKAAGVSGTYVDRATKVLRTADPEVIKAVDEGRMSVTTAAVLASEPPEVQRAEATKPKRNRTYNTISAPFKQPAAGESEKPADQDNGSREVVGVGTILANEAINCLARIPKNDALRSRGLQLVTDWVKANK